MAHPDPEVVVAATNRKVDSIYNGPGYQPRYQVLSIKHHTYPLGCARSYILFVCFYSQRGGDISPRQVQ